MPTKPIAAHDVVADWPGHRRWAGDRDLLVEALTRPRLVVVDEELLQDRLEVPAAEDPKVIEHLTACCPDPALRVSACGDR